MSETSLSTFPTSKISALTMLYLENQDLSNVSPEELLDKYDDVYSKIAEHKKEKLSKQRNSLLK